eukprot:gene3719-biopygen12190
MERALFLLGAARGTEPRLARSGYLWRGETSIQIFCNTSKSNKIESCTNMMRAPSMKRVSNHTGYECGCSGGGGGGSGGGVCSRRPPQPPPMPIQRERLDGQLRFQLES